MDFLSLRSSLVRILHSLLNSEMIGGYGDKRLEIHLSESNWGYNHTEKDSSSGVFTIP